MPVNPWERLKLQRDEEGLRLRLARPDDFARIHACVCHPSTLQAIDETLEYADRTLRQLWAADPRTSEARHFVAEVLPAGDLIAYIRLLYPFPDAGSLWMSFLAVAPEHRGAGYGGRLVRMLLRAARSSPHLRQLGMHTGSANHVAIRLYESAGFRCVERDDDRLTLVQALVPDEAAP